MAAPSVAMRQCALFRQVCPFHLAKPACQPAVRRIQRQAEEEECQDAGRGSARRHRWRAGQLRALASGHRCYQQAEP